MDSLTTGDGKLIGGIVTALLAVGAWLKWMLGREDTREGMRQAKLEAWEKSLVAREKEYREEIEEQLRDLKAEFVSMRSELTETRDELQSTREELQSTRGVLLDVTIDMFALAPDSASLKRAASKLRIALPHYDRRLDTVLPADLKDLVDKLDKDTP